MWWEERRGEGNRGTKGGMEGRREGRACVCACDGCECDVWCVLVMGVSVMCACVSVCL